VQGGGAEGFDVGYVAFVSQDVDQGDRVVYVWRFCSVFSALRAVFSEAKANCSDKELDVIRGFFHLGDPCS
jgi:hypothetical protein